MKPEPGRVVVVEAIPPCDFCADGTPGPFDFRVRGAGWAHGCLEHWRAYRADPGLGVGSGQLWITEEEVTKA